MEVNILHAGGEQHVSCASKNATHLPIAFVSNPRYLNFLSSHDLNSMSGAWSKILLGWVEIVCTMQIPFSFAKRFLFFFFQLAKQRRSYFRYVCWTTGK